MRSTTLAIVPNWLGDTVMALPALAALRRDSRLVAVGSPALLALLTDADLVDATIVYDRRRKHRGWGGLWAVASSCRRQVPARAVAFPPSLRAAALAYLSRAPRRSGYGGVGLSFLLNDRRAPAPRAVHLADAWLALAAGEATSGPALPVLRPGSVGEAQWSRLQASRSSTVSLESTFVLAPGATYGPTKRWPESHFVELARAIHSDTGWTPVVIGGGDPFERSLCANVARDAHGVDLAGETDLSTLAALLGASSGFVGNDSGPMHLAAAVGIPTVGVFGSTSPAWTAPRGPRATACGPHPVDCSPCFQRTCPIGLPCLTNLSVDSVLRAFHEVVAELS